MQHFKCDAIYTLHLLNNVMFCRFISYIFLKCNVTLSITETEYWYGRNVSTLYTELCSVEEKWQ